MKAKPITDLKGVYAGAISAGIKQPPRDDLAFVSVPDAVGSAGVFTRNAFAAAPLIVTKKAQRRGTLKAVIVNAGNANAATGKQGLADATETARLASQLLNLKTHEVAVASTGIIGVPLPMAAMRSGVPKLLLKPNRRDGAAAARAILTTDTRPKEVFLTGQVAGREVTVAGFAKGAGMIAPNMATMLGFLVTDVQADNDELQPLFSRAVDDSFNMTSVDTDTSTNDMSLLFATGNSGAKLSRQSARQEFASLLTKACQVLARMIAADGEGATRLIEVCVRGARNRMAARAIAKDIVDSPLVKTAIHGADPNWGRVVAAAGKNPKWRIDPSRVDVDFAGVPVMRLGVIQDFDRQHVIKELKASEVRIGVHLNLGAETATAWGCDLSHGYIDVNTCYS